MKLRIDREFESKIPPLTADEFQQLEENILADGVVLNPLIVWNGVIVDGHNRYRIIENHPEIKYTTHEKQFDDRHAAIAWICKNQLGRRNLTPEQKKYLIGKQYEAEKASHGAKDGFRGNQHTSLVKCRADTLPNQADTADRIAKENGIGRRSVFRAEAFSKAVDIADEVDPAIRFDLLAGKIKVNSKIIRELVDSAPQDRAVLVTQLRNPPQERRKVLPERKLLTMAQIAAQPLADIENAKPDFMFSELDDAMEVQETSPCMGQNLPPSKTDKEDKDITQKEKREIRRRFGQYQNVFLSEKQIAALEAEYPDRYADCIDRLSAYMEANGKHYANHYATIRKWLDEDNKPKPGKNYDSEYTDKGDCL